MTDLQNGITGCLIATDACIASTVSCGVATGLCIAKTLLAVPGLPGAPGAQGQQGVAGPTGPQGGSGSKGDKGDKGDHGDSYFTQSGNDIFYGSSNGGNLVLQDQFSDASVLNNNSLSIVSGISSGSYLYGSQMTKNKISINYVGNTATTPMVFLQNDTTNNRGYLGFRSPNTTANLYDSRIYESSNGSSGAYNGQGTLSFDANYINLNALVRSSYYNEYVGTTLPISKMGNSTEYILINYQNASPVQIGGITITSSSYITINAPTIYINGSFRCNTNFGSDNYFDVPQFINQLTPYIR